MKLSQTFLLSFIITITGFFGSLASIQAGWGIFGLIVFACLVIALFMTSLTYMRLIYQKTPRGMNILQSIKEVGLIDIEDRNNTDRHLPPDSFLRQAKSEISILGYTCPELSNVSQRLFKKSWIQDVK